MSTEFPFHPGDRIRRPGWRDDQWLDLTAVGAQHVLGFPHNFPTWTAAEERSFEFIAADRWERYVEPPTAPARPEQVYPELWWEIYPGGVGHVRRSAPSGNRTCQDDCIGVVHLHPNGQLSWLNPDGSQRPPEPDEETLAAVRTIDRSVAALVMELPADVYTSAVMHWGDVRALLAGSQRDPQEQP